MDALISCLLVRNGEFADRYALAREADFTNKEVLFDNDRITGYSLVGFKDISRN